MEDKKDFTDDEMRKAVTRGIKKVLAMIEREPKTIIITGNTGVEPDQPMEGITDWLFTRRQDDGQPGD